MSASKKPKLSHHDSKILEKLLENLTCGSPGFPHDERPVVTISPTAKIDEAVKVAKHLVFGCTNNLFHSEIN